MEQHYQENMIEGAMFLLDRKKKLEETHEATEIS